MKIHIVTTTLTIIHNWHSNIPHLQQWLEVTESQVSLTHYHALHCHIASHHTPLCSVEELCTYNYHPLVLAGKRTAPGFLSASQESKWSHEIVWPIRYTNLISSWYYNIILLCMLYSPNLGLFINSPHACTPVSTLVLCTNIEHQDLSRSSIRHLLQWMCVYEGVCACSIKKYSKLFYSQVANKVLK